VGGSILGRYFRGLLTGGQRMLRSAFINKKLMLPARLSACFVLIGSGVASKLKKGTLGSSVDTNRQNYGTVWVTICTYTNNANRYRV
jgi:hypothetical protein